MIVGIGVDLVRIDRIENILSNKENRFLKKIFTKEEIKYILEKNKSPETVSGMFAAKEAVSKVLGTGFGKVSWKDIEVLHDEKNKPYIRLEGEALKVSQELSIDKFCLSISHEKYFGIAIAVGEEIHSKKVDLDNVVVKDFSKILPKRRSDSHKGTYGRVGIIAGSIGMTGACALSSMAALKSGSGLVYGIIPNTLNTILSIKLTEVVFKPVLDNGKGYFIYDSIDQIKDFLESIDVIAIGPGIGTNRETVKVVEEVLRVSEKPVVLDADGLNCISSNPNVLLKRQGATIITPHPGELSRLLKISTKEIQKNRISYSKKVSNKYNVITVLKGANTIVTDTKGDVYVNTTGNPGMATAGSGDVLTGMIASFIGQGVKPELAAKLGVYLHGLSGDLAKIEKGEYGMIARDILESIPYSIKLIENISRNSK